MKKLLTFLGNGEYDEGFYTYRGRKATKSRFVQTAIYELFCHKFTDKDQIIIFLTEEAESKNWQDRVGEYGKNKGKKLIGMEKTWNEINPKLLQQNQIRKVRIPSQQDEKHNWELFEIILNEIDEGDEIIFDITHSFRSFPIMALIILNYARILKNASLKKLLYGCWEMNDRGTPPTAPIIDMTEMIPLLDWAYGVESYLKTGNASVIESLTNNKNGSVKIGVTQEEEDALKELTKQSHEFHQMMQTCRAPEIPRGLDNLRDALNQAKSLKIRGSRHFEELIGKMNEKTEGYTGRPIMDDYWAAKWCYDNGLIQQGYTMLQEGIISAVCRVMWKDLTDSKKKDKTRDKIKKWLQGNPSKELLEKIPNIYKFIDNKDDQLSFKKLTEYRNSMNHAGWNTKDIFRKDGISHEKFHEKLDEFLQFFRPLFEELDQLYQDQQEGAATR